MLGLTTIDPDGTGHRLTDIEGLRWSNVRPGGDESCSFVYKRPWRTDLPEIAKGNIVRVTNGIDVLWQGRIEEHDHGGESMEEIAVTAYGLGARFKDNTFSEIYINRVLGRWGEASTQRRIDLIAAGNRLEASPSIGSQDVGAGGPGIVFAFVNFATGMVEAGEAWYHSGEVDIGEVRYDFDNLVGAATDWTDRISISSDDLLTASDAGTNHAGVDASDQSLVASTSGRKYILARSFYGGASTGTLDHQHAWLNLRVFGRHGLTPTGSQPNEGFYATDMIEDIVGRVDGVVVRRIDDTDVVIPQAEFIESVTHQDAIGSLNRFHLHERTWGTWGPDSVFDTSTDGYFDYTALEPTVQHWYATRSQCDDPSFHSDTSELFDSIEIRYRDAAGRSKTVTATLPALDLPYSRKKTVDGGILDDAIAAGLADALLAISGGFAPARGSVSISQPIRHHTRGELPPVYLRADGSNLRIPDILPSTSLFELDSDPDRRTTFPIRRVEVDAGGKVPTARVELDQGSDWLTALQARLELGADVALG